MKTPSSLEGLDVLLSSARSGNVDAYSTLFSVFQGRLRVIAKSYFAPGFDREDLLQEATIGFFCAIRDYRSGRGSFQAFVSLCVNRRLISVVKSATRGKHRPLNSALSLDKPVHDDSNDALIDGLVIEGKEFGIPGVPSHDDFLMTLAAQCSDLERHVLKMQLAGYTAREIAFDCGVTEKSVNNAQWRVLMKARKLLGKGVAPRLRKGLTAKRCSS